MTIDTSIIIVEGDPLISDTDREYTQSIKDKFKDIDFGITTKFDIKLKSTKTYTVDFFIKYNLGLFDIISNDILTYKSVDKWKNYCLIFGIDLVI